jgi:hypothetical protein
MFGRQANDQSGFALLIFLVVMMGLGGIALTGITQNALKQVEDKKFRHNERVLKEAKQALLMFAYNYPVTHSGQGPGRLPCPYDQIPIGAGSGYSGTISDAICEAVGRMPWSHTDLQLPEFKDADGEHLWYAVSEDFDNNATAIINSDTTGTISIKDQTGNVIYDGSVSGIAAVIIAPGPAIIIDDDDNGSLNYQQVRNRNDPTDIVNFAPKNFLDSAYGGTALSENNFSFTNFALNGFISGPILDGSNTLLINDQIIIIRDDEVIAMAEKATLDAYRTAIKDYLANTGGVYPWLYNYNLPARCDGGVSPESGITQAICFLNGGNWRVIVEYLTSLYPALADFNDPDTVDNYPTNPDPEVDGELIAYLGNMGRIPSTFQDYFTDADSQPIESKLSGSIVMNYPLTSVGHSGGSDFLFNDGKHTLAFQTANKLNNVMFVDLLGQNGQLKGTVTAFEQFSHVTYFWDDSSLPTGRWTMCLDGADVLSDCNRNGAGIPDISVSNNATDSEILRITLTMTFNFGDVVNFDADYNTTPPVISPRIAASNSSHAQIAGTFNGGDVIFGTLPPLTASFEVDDQYDVGDSTFVASNSGTLDNVSDLTLDSITLGLRYYPVLPGWAFDNGWHNSVQMAYAAAYRPDQIGIDCTEGTDCIAINGFPGNQDNKKSLLIIAGEHDWIDGDAAPQPVVAADTFFTDEVDDIFNLENSDLDSTFDIRSVRDPSALGDTQLDKILVIDEL